MQILEGTLMIRRDLIRLLEYRPSNPVDLQHGVLSGEHCPFRFKTRSELGFESRSQWNLCLHKDRCGICLKCCRSTWSIDKKFSRPRQHALTVIAFAFDGAAALSSLLRGVLPSPAAVKLSSQICTCTKVLTPWRFEVTRGAVRSPHGMHCGH